MAEHKECIVCGEQIRTVARKCSHCQSWQSKWKPDATHPLYAMVYLLIVFVALAFFYRAILFRTDFVPGESNLEVEKSQIHFTPDDRGGYISVIGTIRNTGNTTWEDVHFEVRFYDADDNLIDTISENDYDLVALSNDVTAFRIRGRADKPQQLYTRHEVRIKKARESKALF